MSDNTAPVELPAEEAIELAELLEFLAGWLDTNHTGPVARSLKGFTSGGYSIDELGADLARFVFLLGGPGDRLVYGDDQP